MMSPPWFSLRVAGSAIARPLVIHNRQNFPGPTSAWRHSWGGRGRARHRVYRRGWWSEPPRPPVFPRSSVQHRNRVNQLVVMIGHNCKVRKILLRFLGVIRTPMAASVPPPEPEGDQQRDGEEVDEDLEKKVHRRGSDEPDEPDHHRPQHRAEDQPELMTPTPSAIGRPARQAN